MKNILVATVLSLSMATNVCAQVQPAIPSDARIEKKVESLLKKMTLEEKVGQMCEITIDVITDFNSPNDFKLSEALLDTVIGKYQSRFHPECSPQCGTDQRKVGGNYSPNPRKVITRDWYPLYLWCRPNSWYNLYP